MKPGSDGRPRNPAAATTRLAGLLLAVPYLIALDLPALARAAGYRARSGHAILRMVTASRPPASAIRTAAAAMAARSCRGLGPRAPRSGRSQIDALPMTVWAVLTGLDSYPDWNPLFRGASGQIAVGSRITLRSVHPANGRMMTVRPKITAADPGAELRWTSNLPPFISGEHSFTLTEADGGTRLVQAETFSGLLVPLSGKTFARAETSFQDLNEAIKKRAQAS